VTAVPRAAENRGRGRLARFAGVGSVGFILQLLVLWALTRAGVHYLVATAIAVEAAILHNYVWHERWTWSDRSIPVGVRWQRALRFNLLAAVISVSGNLGLMRVLAGGFGVPLLAANTITVGILSLANFVAADRMVFRPVSAPAR
jgi:dolichol-phosphate mannosyltransferase